MKYLRTLGTTLLWWIGSLILSCENVQGQGRPVVVMDSSIVQELNHIADTATVEHARCLYGSAAPDTLYLQRTVEPVVVSATEGTINTKPCPFGALGFWHAHIARQIAINGQMSADGQLNAAYCYLSQADVQASVLPGSPPLQMVGVGNGILCWWDIYQIVPVAHGQLPILPTQYLGPHP